MLLLVLGQELQRVTSEICTRTTILVGTLGSVTKPNVGKMLGIDSGVIFSEIAMDEVSPPSIFSPQGSWGEGGSRRIAADRPGDARWGLLLLFVGCIWHSFFGR